MSNQQLKLAEHNRAYRKRRDVKWPKDGFHYQRDPNRIRISRHSSRMREAPHIMSPLAAALRALIDQEQVKAVSVQQQRTSFGLGHNTRGYRMGRATQGRSRQKSARPVFANLGETQ